MRLEEKMCDKNRKDKIEDKVIVDCYDDYEMTMGWFYYLEDNMTFPFQASIVGDIRMGSLKKGDIVEVIEFVNSDTDNEPIDEFVATAGIKKDEDIYDIPLQMIKGVDCDKDTDNAIEDWRYWCEKF